MANEIARHFEAGSDRAAAVEGLVQHLRRFWEPRLRRELVDRLDAGGEGLRPIVMECLRARRDVLLSPTHES